MKRSSPTRFLLLGLILCAPRASTAQGIPVTGTVLDEAGRPLAGAEVTLHPMGTLAERGAARLVGEPYPEAEARAVSGRDGRFRVEAPEPGFWAVFARAQDRVPAYYSLGPLLGPEELDPVRLLPDAGLRVRVTDEAGGAVPGAVVELDGSGPAERVYRRDGSWRLPSHRLAPADADGRVRLARFEGEEVEVLWAATPGRIARMEVGEPPAGKPVRLVLAPGPTRRVRVLDPDGRPVAGAVVWFSAPIPAGLTGEDGTLEVPLSEDDPGEPVEIQVDSPDGLVAEAEIRALREDEEPTPLEIRLERPPTVSGRVLEADTGEGLADALVWLYRDAAATVRADRTGSFRLPVRREWNEEHVVAAAPGYLLEHSSLPDRRRAASEEVVLSLEPAVALEGTVVDAGGDPVPGAEVRVLPEGGGRRAFSGAPPFARSGRDGGFRVAGLEPERVHVVHARRDGYSPAMERVPPAPAPRGAGGARRPGPLPEVRIVLHETLSLRGRAVGRDGEPVAGARVVAVPEESVRVPWRGDPPGVVEGETGADGSFELAEVLAGPTDVAASAPGYAPFRKEGVEIPSAGGGLDLGDLVLEPEAFLEGRVVDPEGAAIAGAQVRARIRTGPTWIRRVSQSLRGGQESATTGDDGRFRIGGLAPGEPAGLQAEKEGWVQTSLDGLRPPTEEPVVVVLQPAATLAGVVVDERGRPVPDAQVSRSWRVQRSTPGGAGFEPRRTDERGAFEVTGLSPGWVAVEARAPGYQVSQPLSVELAPGERREGVELVLREGVAVTGRVLGPDGLPVAGARVATRIEEGASYFVGMGSDETGADGRYRLDTLAPGRAVLEARKEGFAAASREVEVGPGGASVDIHLERGAEVSGWVVESDGSPGAGRQVQLSGQRRFVNRSGRVTTAADGSFLFQGVSDGEYRLVVFEGYSPLWTGPEPVRVEGGAPVTGLEIRLDAAATLRGRIVGLGPDELQGVEVMAALLGEGIHGRRSGEVLDDGRYRITGLTQGRWSVTAAAHRSRRRAEGWVEIEEGQTEAVLDLELGAGYTLTGTVLSGGEPLSGVRVSVGGWSLTGGTRTTTGADGRFRLEGVPEGDQMLVLQDPSTGGMETRQIEIAGDREIRVELDSYRVRGAVYAADGSGPIAGASVQLQREPSEASGERPVFSMGRETSTGEDGSFLVTGVGPGRWRLRVEEPGYAVHSSTVEVAEGDVEAAPVFLEPADRLEIVARLPDGRPPAEVVATVLGPGERLVTRRHLRPVDPGRFVLDTVPAGSWNLVLSAVEGPAVRVEVEAPGTVEVVFPEPSTLVVSVPELAADGETAFVAVTDPAGTTPFFGGSFALERALVTGGRAELKNLPPGTWKVTVNTMDGRTWSGTTTVDPASPNHVVLE